MATRWGIVGLGKISHDFVLCLLSLPSEDHQIVAVAARNIENAKKFAIEHSLEGTKIHKSYDELAQDPVVEIVYVGNIYKDHLKVSRMLLESGKHVLCEKPMCVNLKETEMLIKTARESKRFLMEAMWSRFSPLYEQLRKEIQQGTIGTPNLIHILFAIIQPARKMDVSVILEIGIYAVQLALMVFGKEKPLKIMAHGFLNKDGVDEVATVTLEFSQKRIANFTVSLRNEGYNEAIISGTHGFIRMLPPFYCPTVLVTPNQKYEIELPKVKGKMNCGNCEGLIYEAMAVREYLQQGLLEGPLMPLEESRLISDIMTEIKSKLSSP